MSEHVANALAALDELQAQHELTLVKLREPFLSSQEEQQPFHTSSLNQRTSDASCTTEQTPSYPTPTSLAADLTHYRDLFTKLRFSYTEQVTKEKFLRYLVASPPPPAEHISPAANAELEAQLAEIKDTLKQQKAAVDSQLAEIEAHARELSRRQQEVDTQAQELRELPNVLEDLKREIVEMRDQQGIGGEVGDGQAEMGMGLEATVNLVEEREAQLDKVSGRFEEVEEQRARKDKELRRLEEELGAAERERDRAVKAADDAQRRRQEGKNGTGDAIERRGRWLKGVETTMTRLLEV